MQYPTIGQPQYGFAPTMPGMASGGLASLPIRRFQSGGSTGPYKYSYDPKTQRYTLLSSGEQADQMLAAQGKLPPYEPSGPGSESGAPPGSPGSAPSPSLLTDAVVGLHSTMQNLQEISPLVNLAPGVMGLTTVSRAGMDALIDQEAKAAAQLKAANEQMVPSRVSYSHFNLGPQVSLDPNISVSPVPDPAMQQVTSIAPDVVTPGLPVTDQDINVDPTAALTAMNVQQTDEQDPSTPDISDVAATVAATQDAVDADAGAVSAANAAAAGAPAAPAGDVGGGGGAGTGTPSTADQQNVDANMNVQDAPDAGGGGGGTSCFLTTAAVRYMGQKDNGEVLNTLRNFRDTYMQKDREKNKDVQWYYTNAPRIMRALDARKDAGSIYREMYNDYVIPAYRNIKAGKNAEAYADYKKLVNFAKRESGIDNDDLTPKPKHYMSGGQVMNYEQGGLAAARQAQSKGRGQDTMLVHMTPGEVRGLQALAMSQGGSLTINPQTGLPEAGFLSSILPMIAGFALGPAGFAMMSAPMAGLTVGALTGIATGSLKKGLMAGLGAYGGAGLGQGLVNAATPMEAAQTGIVADPSLINTSATQFPTKDITFGQTPDFGASQAALPDFPVKNTTYGQTFGTPESGLDFSSSKNQFFDQLPPPPQVQPTGFQGAGSGLQNIIQTGPEGTAARSAFMKGAPTGSLMAAGTSLASGLTPEPAPLPTSKSFLRGYDLDITNPSGMPQYTPQDTREREQVRYVYRPRPILEAAQGGLAALNGQTYDDEYGRDEYKAGGQTKVKPRSLRGNPYYKFAQDRKDSSMEAAIKQNFAKGGLGAALPPRFLQGAGDGMSDSIKARIGGVQEARLADGEFVIPADVVSHLGNGSSKAGAKKLYSMMDKIRKARTGRTRQAPEVNPNKYMPA